MVRSRIGTYILLMVVALSFVTLVAMTWAAGRERQAAIRQERIRNLETAVQLVKASVLNEKEPDLLDEDLLQRHVKRYAAESGLYLTIISDGGRVLADSLYPPRRMENQRDLSEFRDADQRNFGYAERLLADQEVTMILVAQRVVHDGNTIAFVRAGTPKTNLASSSEAIALVVGCIAFGTIIAGIVLTRIVETKAVDPVIDLTEACDALAENGEMKHLWNSSRDELGQLVRHFQAMALAVTQRETALRDQANRIETVLGSMVEGVLAVNADRVVLLANQAVRRLLGIRADRVEGRPLIEITRIRALDQSVQQAMSTGEACSTEFEVSSPFRRVINIQANCLPGDPCPGVVLVLHDMTELRRLENLRREFVANVSHELKTPLAAIRAYAETLHMGAVDDAENRDYFLGQITDQSDRLHDLIMDMLQLARVEAGQEVFDITDVNVADIAQWSVDSLRDKAAAKDIRLVVETAEDDEVYVRADEEGLRTIVGNLVDNAVKYSGMPGDVLVRWKTEGDQVAISVQDHGIGIPQEAQDRIFERFFRVDKARSREMGGTGLGLSIVKHLAGSFGGSVELDSAPGEGSVFTVRLKRSRVLTN
ncbi:PAS domain-containing sensor histidine kinase [Blastopirellula marina]|uniref:histidine kinase n=1 Tax=Blastopirellula marina TaxID=124 RepID=A0A2S8F059_9BACT|nr:MULTISPECIES: ATP-binding protein [Pirellulaceae]PQO25545.1 PAS domain-containing sensor histidine kinase [Blastopirellula marina]RCS42509.1 sensor histidine kinase [Bremerella cremea]